MKKNEQMKINALCVAYSKLAAKDAERWHGDFVRLHKCSAAVCRTNDFEILRSYNTIVAMYHIKSGILIDILRREYGYTATSAQHIAKFRKIMTQRYGSCEMMRYYPV